MRSSNFLAPGARSGVERTPEKNGAVQTLIFSTTFYRIFRRIHNMGLEHNPKKGGGPGHTRHTRQRPPCPVHMYILCIILITSDGLGTVFSGIKRARACPNVQFGHQACRACPKLKIRASSQFGHQANSGIKPRRACPKLKIRASSHIGHARIYRV